jgi:hypothetical protein
MAIHETRSGSGITVGRVAHSRFNVVTLSILTPCTWACRSCWAACIVLIIVTTTPEGHGAFADHARCRTTRLVIGEMRMGDRRRDGYTDEKRKYGHSLMRGGSKYGIPRFLGQGLMESWPEVNPSRRLMTRRGEHRLCTCSSQAKAMVDLGAARGPSVPKTGSSLH